MTITNPCLGYAETEFLSITAVIADAMMKEAQVELLGLEPNGTQGICIRIGADDPASLHSALEKAASLAETLGSKAFCAAVPRPNQILRELNSGPKTINGLYGGREELKPSDYPENQKKTMKDSTALGILETQGLTASVVGSDVMFKTASVELVGKEKIGAAYVTVMIKGDVAAVKAAIEAGSQAAAEHGKVIAAFTIASPHPDLTALLPK